MSDDDVAKWTKRAVRWATNMRAAEEKAKAKPPSPRPATKRGIPPLVTPPRRPGVTIHAAPAETPVRPWSAGEEAQARMKAQAMMTPPDTDAHEVDESPCYVCGGPVRVSVWFGRWRQHPECAGLVGWQPARVQAACRALALGEVSMVEAAVLDVSVPRFSDTHREPTWTNERLRDRMPWRHVDRAALKAAVQSLPTLRVQAGLDACTCTAGACAWCGRADAMEWWADGHTWPDGSPAPLCGACHAVYVSNGSPSPSDWVSQRTAISEAVTGVPPMMGEAPPDGITGYAERPTESTESPESTVSNEGVGGVSDAPPTPHIEPSEPSKPSEPSAAGTPWAHLNPDALRSYRFTVWARYGLAYCPPEHREAVTAWAGERDAVRAAKSAEKQAEEAVRANVHGF